MFCHRSCLCVAVSAGNCRQKPLYVKMASVIETEFRIRTLQAPLGERRNKDLLGHIFCNLRLIIVPGGTYKGRGDMRRSPLPLLVRSALQPSCRDRGDWRGPRTPLGCGGVVGGLPAALHSGSGLLVRPSQCCTLAARRRERLPGSVLNWMLKFWFYGYAEDLWAQVLALAQWVWLSAEHWKALH